MIHFRLVADFMFMFLNVISAFQSHNDDDATLTTKAFFQINIFYLCELFFSVSLLCFTMWNAKYVTQIKQFL